MDLFSSGNEQLLINSANQFEINNTTLDGYFQKNTKEIIIAKNYRQRQVPALYKDITTCKVSMGNQWLTDGRTASPVCHQSQVMVGRKRQKANWTCLRTKTVASDTGGPRLK